MKLPKIKISKKVLLGLVVYVVVACWLNSMAIQIRGKIAADQYVETRVADMEELVRQRGLSDFKIECKKDQKSAFISEFPGKKVEMDRPCYYYHLDHYSDEIAYLYQSSLEENQGDILVDMMSDIGVILNECTGNKKYNWEYIEYRDGYINTYFKHKYPEKCVFIETSDGDMYGYVMGEQTGKLYINDKLVYETLYENLENLSEGLTKPSKSTSKPKDDYGYWGGSYDPYDVEDYSDPDDFADEWADEFGDGNYEDGYDDAYDYWEDAY